MSPMLHDASQQPERHPEARRLLDSGLSDLPLNGDGPFDQAWMLLAWVQTSFEIAQWQDVFKRAQRLDDGLRTAAIRRLGDVMSGHPQSRALSALNTAAREMAYDADLPLETTPRRQPVERRARRMSREARGAAARASAHAALSLALAPQLEPVDVALLASPVLATLRALFEGRGVLPELSMP